MPWNSRFYLLKTLILLNMTFAPRTGRASFWSCTSGANTESPRATKCRHQKLAEIQLDRVISAQRSLLLSALQGHKDQTMILDYLNTYKIQEVVWILDKEGFSGSATDLRYALEQYLRNGNIVRISPLGGGATTTRLAHFANGKHPREAIRAVFKPEQRNLSSNIRSEAGCYVVDKLLELNIIPATIKRDVEETGYPGSLQYFVSTAVSAGQLPPSKRQKGARMLLLDYWTKNIDRHEDNYLWLPVPGIMVGIDNSWALRGGHIFAEIKGAFVDKRSENEKKMLFPDDQIPSQKLYEKLRDLKDSTVRNALDGVVCKSSINNLIGRKKKLLNTLRKARARARD